MRHPRRIRSRMRPTKDCRSPVTQCKDVNTVHFRKISRRRRRRENVSCRSNARHASITSLLPQESANQSVCLYIYIYNVTRAQYRSRLTRCHLDATSAPEARSFTIFPRDRDRMHRVVCTCLTLPPARNYTALSSPIISATTRRFSIRARKTR